MKTTLLASAASKEDIVKMIQKYWYAKDGSIVLLKTSPITWGIWQNDVEMGEFQVKQKGLRFRFEFKGVK